MTTGPQRGASESGARAHKAKQVELGGGTTPDADNDHAGEGCQPVLGPFEVGRANELEKDVYRCEIGDCRGGNDLVSTERPQGGLVLAVTSNGNYVRAKETSDLNGRGADATGRTGDEHALARPQVGLHDEGIKSGEKDLGKATSFNIAGRIGNGNEVGGRNKRLSRKGPTADDGADPRATEGRINVLSDGRLGAGLFETGNFLRPAGRRGVEAATLEQVGRIEAGGNDVDQHFVGPGGRPGPFGQGKGGGVENECVHVATLKTDRRVIVQNSLG